MALGNYKVMSSEGLALDKCPIANDNGNRFLAVRFIQILDKCKILRNLNIFVVVLASGRGSRNFLDVILIIFYFEIKNIHFY